MSAIIRLLDAEITRYESLLKNLKATRDAIAASELLPSARGTKRRGRPRKSASENRMTPKSASSGVGRGRPRKKATLAGAATSAD